MDAMPLTFEQELGAWAAQLAGNEKRLVQAVEQFAELAIGGTAVGTGINAHPDFAKTVVAKINQATSLEFPRGQQPLCTDRGTRRQRSTVRRTEHAGSHADENQQ